MSWIIIDETWWNMWSKWICPSNGVTLSCLLNWLNSQIPQCTCPISHNAPFRTEICTFLFWMVHCGIWDRCIVGFVILFYYITRCLYNVTQFPYVSRHHRADWMHYEHSYSSRPHLDPCRSRRLNISFCPPTTASSTLFECATNADNVCCSSCTLSSARWREYKRERD